MIQNCIILPLLLVMGSFGKILGIYSDPIDMSVEMNLLNSGCKKERSTTLQLSDVQSSPVSVLQWPALGTLAAG